MRKSRTSPLLVAMSREVILDNREVRDRDVRHGGVVSVAVLDNHEIAPPGRLLLVEPALGLANELVDREGHAITGDGGIEDDIWSAELLGHAVQCLNQLGPPMRGAISESSLRKRWKGPYMK